ncbi:MAG TPA: ABC transporter ATP-binding protein [Dehalococcoidia bacterium]|nr:ABC transporter ATP-binding protein [Dehalococcoidia bacterium]
MNAIHVENLSKRFGEKEVLKGVNLKIAEGEFYALMGPNGSGKTTLASIIASIRKPTSGRLEIYGRRPEDAKELIGYVPQENFSSPKLTARENLTYFARLLNYPAAETKTLVADMLAKIGLAADADKRVEKFSGGMRKRLEAATALFPGVKILILDEPTTGLDPAARRNFFSLITAAKDKKTTILLITHLGSDAELASRVGLIDNGIIIAEDEPETLIRNHGLEDVITVETAVKSDHIIDTLKELSIDRRLLETEEGYRIYSRDGGRVLAEVARSLEHAGYKVMRLEMTRPSLEDVFFRLTEKTMSEAL